MVETLSPLLIPLTRAAQASGHRITDALVSLSIAEVRPSITMMQLVDTVNELHAAVGESISLVQLFVSELEINAKARQVSLETLASLTRTRDGARGGDSALYRTTSNLMLDEIRRLRTLSPPSMAACSILAAKPVVVDLSQKQASATKTKSKEFDPVKEQYKKRRRKL